MKSDNNGNFTIKKVYTFMFFIVFLISIGYSFAITFKINPLEKKVDKMEKKVDLNEKFADEMNIHFEYIRDDLETIKAEIRKLNEK